MRLRYGMRRGISSRGILCRMGMENARHRRRKSIGAFIAAKGHDHALPHISPEEFRAELARAFNAGGKAAGGAALAVHLLATPAHAASDAPPTSIAQILHAEERAALDELFSRSMEDLVREDEAARLGKNPERALSWRERQCIIKNVVGEAASEGKEGRDAVVFVTLNRLMTPGYPRDACGVVYQRSQFSWTNDDAHRVKIEARAEERAYLFITEHVEELLAENRIAEARALLATRLRMPDETLFYKRTDNRGVSERSRLMFESSMEAVRTVGAHTFYRLKATR